MGSFSTPLSGLTAAQGQLQSVSNNLANINTDGYKDQTLTFADVFSQTGVTNGSGDPVQTGSGVTISSTDSDFTEGSLNATGTASNMALSGKWVLCHAEFERFARLHTRRRLYHQQCRTNHDTQRGIVAGISGSQRSGEHRDDFTAVAGGHRCDQPRSGQHHHQHFGQS